MAWHGMAFAHCQQAVGVPELLDDLGDIAALAVPKMVGVAVPCTANCGMDIRQKK